VSEIKMGADVQSVLMQMRALQAQAQAGLEQTSVRETAPESEAGSFPDMLASATQAVNKIQSESGALASSFARGETDDLVSVMVASQKSSVAFQGLLHTRNHLVRAYQEIMRMPI